MILSRRLKVVALALFLTTGLFFAATSFFAEAKNIYTYKDTISHSKPEMLANHTLAFELGSDIAPGGYLDFAFPSGFEILATSSFDVRNVEMIVDGTSRVASSGLSFFEDQVVITPGDAGSIRYNLNPTTGLDEGSDVVFKIGTHTSNAIQFSETYSTTTNSTTTIYGDIGVKNSNVLGRHDVSLRTSGATEPTYADFVIFLLESVEIENVDTTEEVPPFRFNGSPSGQVGGTTISVEVVVETDEFAICKYSTTPGVDYYSMTNSFTSTGLVVHTFVTAVAPETTYNFYVRCLDDEGNENIDDYLINFTVNAIPDGEPDPDGDGGDDGDGDGDSDSESGDGSGNGNGGSGSGSSGGSGSGGGGGGGGSGDGDDSDDAGGDEDGAYQSGDATVIINGYAFPRSRITVLVDGNQAITSTAGNDGRFSATIDAIARGVYTFGIYATDPNNVKSSTFSTTFSVQGARTSNLSNINIMPSIKVTPDPVNPGQTLTFTGYAIPNSTITIENQKDKSSATLKSFTTTSGSSGAWTLTVDTNGFTNGTYKVRAKSAQTDGAFTNFSNYTFYGVGERAATGINADLNRDGKVNLIDFSILLFWWGRDGGTSDPPADINRDGTVSLTDFSILLFNWTG